MNNLIKIMCVSVMLSGTALAQDGKIDGKKDKDRSGVPVTIVILKTNDDAFDITKYKNEKLIIQDKNGNKRLVKIDSSTGVGTDGIR